MGTTTNDRIPEKRRTALVIAPRSDGGQEIASVLQGQGFRVQTFHNVYEAIAAFTDKPSKLVVLSLAGLSRKERRVLEVFRRRAPELRVLLLVPEGRRADVPPYLKAGADAFLPAPATGLEIQLIVRSLLRGDAADPLTGLPNAEAYERAFEREAARARRADQGLGLAIIDLDHFGAVNAEHGYQVANKVLCDVAEGLESSFRIQDLAARWGGDEFVALVTQLPLLREDACSVMRAVLERVRAQICQRDLPVRIEDGTRVHVTFSCGAAIYPYESRKRQGLFDIANRRLLRAKTARDDPQGEHVVCCDKDERGEPPAGA